MTGVAPRATRRGFVGAVVGRGCAICAGAALAQRPKPVYFGCAIAPERQRLLTVIDQQRSQRLLSSYTSGADRASFNTALGQVLVGLSRIYGQKPSFEFYDDAKGHNAFASTETKADVANTNGTVSFGVNLLDDMLRQEGGDMAVFAVCAHEFGHIYQFNTEWKQTIQARLPGYCLELHADYLAGFCLSHYARAYPEVNIRPVGPVWKSLGSADFVNPDFHGTPEQRLAAIEAGFALVRRDETATAAVAAKKGFEHVSRYA